MFKFKNIDFDDFTSDENGTWSQICKSCVKEHNIDKEYLDETGSGICGIERCTNESDYYIDFK